jgi:3-hydroxyisobutyrate dehydrogenase-like beta-hydroxyacid dehydrogenase
MRIGFIGLGNMGGGMATDLVRAGHKVCAVDPVPEALERARPWVQKPPRPCARRWWRPMR